MNNNYNGLPVSLAAISLLTFTLNPSQANAHGEDHENSNRASYPYVSGHIDLSIHADSIIDAPDEDEEINEVFSHSHADLKLHMNEEVSINTKVKLEGESSGHSHQHSSSFHGDKYFEDHELFVQELTVNYDNDDIALYAGKFNPIVGIDYHSMPGVYGYQKVEEYAILERIGAGVGLKVDSKNYGNHRIDVSSFFDDTTFLSDSLINQRGHTSEEDGGISNTEDFSSYAVSLGAENLQVPAAKVLNGFSYRVGAATQAKGSGDDSDETRYTAAVGYEVKITEDVSAKIITEYADVSHWGGEEHHDRAYRTAATGLYYKGWNAAVSYTDIGNDAEDDHDDHDGYVAQVSGGYKFDNGIGVDLGYRNSDEDGDKRDTVGLLVSYSISF